MGKSTISMAIFNCYVSSPEGTLPKRKHAVYMSNIVKYSSSKLAEKTYPTWSTCQKTMENPPIYSGCSHEPWWFSVVFGLFTSKSSRKTAQRTGEFPAWLPRGRWPTRSRRRTSLGARASSHFGTESGTRNLGAMIPWHLCICGYIYILLYYYIIYNILYIIYIIYYILYIIYYILYIIYYIYSICVLYIILCYIMLYYVILYYIILYYIILKMTIYTLYMYIWMYR